MRLARRRCIFFLFLDSFGYLCPQCPLFWCSLEGGHCFIFEAGEDGSCGVWERWRRGYVVRKALRFALLLLRSAIVIPYQRRWARYGWIIQRSIKSYCTCHWIFGCELWFGSNSTDRSKWELHNIAHPKSLPFYKTPWFCFEKALNVGIWLQVIRDAIMKGAHTFEVRGVALLTEFDIRWSFESFPFEQMVEPILECCLISTVVSKEDRPSHTISSLAGD